MRLLISRGALAAALLSSLAAATPAAAEPPPMGMHFFDVGHAEAAAAAPAIAATPVPASPIETHVLAAQPLCEASAILTAPWDAKLDLVADNEIDDQLYGFDLAKGVPEPKQIVQMPAKHRPEDIEALALLGDELVVVGSHSRNRDCERQPDRQRIRRLKAPQGGTVEEAGFLDSTPAWQEAMEHEGAQCLSTLFTSPPPAKAAEVCRAFVAAEKRAEQHDGPCETLNVEGAVGTADGRLWLGLRAPLAENRAILLRLVEGVSRLQFDRVVLLDLEGRGIRDLALAGDQLYGLAGPQEDSVAPFALFRGAAALLGGGATAVEILRRDLVTSSEGLLVRGKRAFVVVDGDEPAKGDRTGVCTSPARWYTIELPDV